MKFNGNSLYSRYYKQYSDRKHRDRLSEITAGKFKINVERPNSHKNLPMLSRAFNYKLYKEAIDVKNQNKVMFNKLTQEYTKPPAISKLSPRMGHSLNYPYRKSETKKINNENKRIVRRLSETTSPLNHRRLESHMKFIKQYRQSRRKIWRNSQNFTPIRSRSSQRPTIKVEKRTQYTTTIGKYYNDVSKCENNVEFFVKNVKKYQMGHRSTKNRHSYNKRIEI